MSGQQQLLLGTGVSAAANYIEDVFATTLFIGNGGTQTITTGVDLSTFGGLVWGKQRLPSNQAAWHELTDTARGFGSTGRLSSNSTNAGMTGDVTGVTTSGVTLGTVSGNLNTQDWQSVLWSFRKQPKFFDVVTYTGNGSTQNIAHSLGSTPGCIIVKRTNTTGSWRVFHRSVSTQYGNLNSTAAFQTTSAENVWGNNSTTVAPTSTQFTVGNDSSVNASGSTYVAYLFAHDAGGFGLTGTDNVISCGSFTTDGSGNATVNLGYEPQWLMIKTSSTTDNWWVWDTMRGWSLTGYALLNPNLADAESTSSTVSLGNPTATGFTIAGLPPNNSTSIYIAIRRGPMKTPTSGTSVFSPATTSSSSSPLTVTTNFPVDLTLNRLRDAVYDTYAIDRLRGSSTTSSQYLRTDLTVAETNGGGGFGIGFDNNTAIVDNGFLSGNTNSKIYWNFRRAPGFFDVVCYTGNGSTQAVTHNLRVAPEIIIVKNRTSARDWFVYLAPLGVSYRAFLNSTVAATNTGPESAWGNNSTTVAPTSTQFTVGTYPGLNASGENLVAYLFASCPGVSKVGSYTGTGNTLQVDCGFTGGARFVLIKRTDSTGDWYVWDSARGIVAGNDPYLLLNSTAAEVTNTDYVDTFSSGFEISSTAPAAINANGGTFIFLAIA